MRIDFTNNTVETDIYLKNKDYDDEDNVISSIKWSLDIYWNDRGIKDIIATIHSINVSYEEVTWQDSGPDTIVDKELTLTSSNFNIKTENVEISSSLEPTSIYIDMQTKEATVSFN